MERTKYNKKNDRIGEAWFGTRCACVNGDGGGGGGDGGSGRSREPGRREPDASEDEAEKKDGRARYRGRGRRRRRRRRPHSHRFDLSFTSHYPITAVPILHVSLDVQTLSPSTPPPPQQPPPAAYPPSSYHARRCSLSRRLEFRCGYRRRSRHDDVTSLGRPASPSFVPPMVCRRRPQQHFVVVEYYCCCVTEKEGATRNRIDIGRKRSFSSTRKTLIPTNSPPIASAYTTFVFKTV